MGEDSGGIDYSYSKQYYARLTVLCKIFLTFNLNDGIFYIIMLVAEYTVMDLNNVPGFSLSE